MTVIFIKIATLPFILITLVVNITQETGICVKLMAYFIISQLN